jgi:hypothetical protein
VFVILARVAEGVRSAQFGAVAVVALGLEAVIAVVVDLTTIRMAIARARELSP